MFFGAVEITELKRRKLNLRLATARADLSSKWRNLALEQRVPGMK
jgi:hypothetical protein